MKPARIVLVEDNPGDVLLFEMALKESGIPCEFMLFDNGTEALRALSAPEATAFVPDAILLDLNTPRTDGFEVLIKLTQSPRLSHVPIAILTSSRASSDKHRAALQGVRFIQKPSHSEEFLAIVGGAVKEMLHVHICGSSCPVSVKDMNSRSSDSGSVRDRPPHRVTPRALRGQHNCIRKTFSNYPFMGEPS